MIFQRGIEREGNAISAFTAPHLLSLGVSGAVADDLALKASFSNSSRGEPLTEIDTVIHTVDDRNREVSGYEVWRRLVALAVAEWLQCTNSVGFVESFLCGFSVPFLSASTGVDLLARAGIGKSIRVAIGFPFYPRPKSKAPTFSAASLRIEGSTC